MVQEQRAKFIDGCVKTGVGKAVGEKVFAFIERSPATVSIALMLPVTRSSGYQTAYLKAHYPAEFMAALLTSDQDNIDRIAIEVREAREMGMEVLAPDVNESFEEFAVARDETLPSGGRIRFGLNAIKNVGHVIAREIVEERKRGGKYLSLENFLERIQSKDLNKKSLEALIKVGALEGFGERGLLLFNLDTLVKYAKNAKNLASDHEQSLFGAMPLPEAKLSLARCEPAPQEDLPSVGKRASWLVRERSSPHPRTKRISSAPLFLSTNWKNSQTKPAYASGGSLPRSAKSSPKTAVPCTSSALKTFPGE